MGKSSWQNDLGIWEDELYSRVLLKSSLLLEDELVKLRAQSIDDQKAIVRTT